MGDTLSAREKNDLYWQKRKYYISVLNSKGGFKERFLNADTAEDVMECYDTFDKETQHFIPVGDEFLPFPPAAGGEKYFADSVARLCHAAETMNEKSVEEILSDENFGEETKKVFTQGMCGIGDMLGKLLADYFAASGYVDRKVTDDEEARKKGRASFKTSLAEYEKNLGEVFSKFGSSVIEAMAEETGTKAETKPAVEDTGFEALVDEAEGASLVENEIDGLRERIKALSAERQELEAVRDNLQKQVIDSYIKRTNDPILRKVMARTFLEYRMGVDNRLRELSDIRQACYYFAYVLISDEPVDALTAEKIEKYIEDDAEVMNEGTPFMKVHGYEAPNPDLELSVDEPKDYESMCAMAEELRDYLVKHPGVLDNQSLLSVAGCYSELSLVAEKARVLARASDRYSRSGEIGKTDRATWLVVFENWVLADSICRVAYPVLEFLEETMRTTVSDSGEKLRALLPDISYTFAERAGRVALQKIILERSGVDAISK